MMSREVFLRGSSFLDFTAEALRPQRKTVLDRDSSHVMMNMKNLMSPWGLTEFFHVPICLGVSAPLRWISESPPHPRNLETAVRFDTME
jgi:hypothetical protein